MEKAMVDAGENNRRESAMIKKIITKLIRRTNYSSVSGIKPNLLKHVP